MKKLVHAGLVLLVLATGLIGCAPPVEQPTAEVEQPTVEQATEPPAAEEPAAEVKVLKVGLNSENVPWEFMRDGELVGFEVDMLNELAKRMDVELEFTTVPFSGIFTGLQSEKWDLASSSIWITEERLKEMDFADPYYDSDMALMTQADSSIASFEDMAGGVFGADTGSMNDQWLKDNVDKYGPYEIKNYDSPTDAFLDLQAGRLDGVVADSPTALYYVQENADAGLDVPLLMNIGFPQAWAFRKGDPLRDTVNDIQNEMKEDGTLAAIYEKWFGQAPPAGSSTVTVYEGGYQLPTAGTGEFEWPAVLKVGLNSENVPWEFMRDGELVGFEVDMLNELAKRAGIELEFITVPFSGIFTGLQSEKWDLASSSIWITEERLKEMDFADPYYDSDMALMTQADSSIASFEDMAGGVFGADTGSMNDQWLKDNVDTYGPYEIKNYDSPTDAFLDLQAGRLDGVVADSPTALYYVQQNPDAGLDVPLLMNIGFPQAWAFRKGDPLRDAANEIQNEMKEDGTLAAIYEKWFGQAPPAGSSTVTVYEGGYELSKPETSAYEWPAVLKVGLNSENVPWEFMRDGELVGFEVDMLNELAQRAGIELEFITVPFSGIFTGLQSEKWDLASSSIWITEERLKEMDFADPYYDSDMALMTQADSSIASFEDMAGGVFGADTGSMNDQWLKDNVDTYGPYEIKNYDSPTDAFLDLQAGRLDGVVADSPTALYYVQQNPDAGLDVPLLMNIGFPQAWAFRKGDPLRDAANEIQNEMKEDGTLASIYEKWFGQAPPADSSTITVYEGGYELP
jgi:polar amino acid transport system substrate-binding protein